MIYCFIQVLYYCAKFSQTSKHIVISLIVFTFLNFLSLLHEFQHLDYKFIICNTEVMQESLINVVQTSVCSVGVVNIMVLPGLWLLNRQLEKKRKY